MRRCYLVCYDIRDPKRLRQVFKICKGYGEHWQYSIFFCAIRDIDRVTLQTELESVMHMDEDQILIIDLGENEASARFNTTALGQPMDDALDLDVVLGLVSWPGHKSQTRNLLKRLDPLAIVAAVDVANLVESATFDSTQCSQNVNRKGRREWATKIVKDVEKACGFRYREPSAGGRRHAEFSVMLDHAARRLSQTHSWIKLAETERNTFDKDARRSKS